MPRCCMECMQEMQEGETLCSACGFDHAHYMQPEFALPIGTQLHAGKYLVGKMLGQGGFGITYVGLDLALEMKVAIKEYYPFHMASRSADTVSLTWHSTVADRDAGRGGFVKEARKMAKIHRIPSVVEVRDVFYENDTAYIVMDFLEGETLKARLERLGRMTMEDCIRTLRPIMEALDMAHQRGLIHRDVSPDNIMLDPQGNPWLLDLGAAKDIGTRGGDQMQSSQAVIKRGFSPPEQMASGGKIGPWTDVYAMCATIYYCVYGKLVPEALDRAMGARVPMPEGIPAELAKTLEHGLALRSEDRIQSMRELLDELKGAAARESEEREAAAQAAREVEEREAAERAARESEEREAAVQTAREVEEREAAVQTAREAEEQRPSAEVCSGGGAETRAEPNAQSALYRLKHPTKREWLFFAAELLTLGIVHK